MKYLINSTGNTIIADQDFVDAVYPGDHTLLPDDQVAVPAPIRIITKLTYMNRFTDAELAGIYTAAKSVVQIEIWLEKFKLASEINLDDPYTIAGLQAMEVSGLIATGRAAEILA